MSVQVCFLPRDTGIAWTQLGTSACHSPCRALSPARRAQLALGPQGRGLGFHRSRIMSFRLSFAYLGPCPPTPGAHPRGTLCLLGDVPQSKSCLGRAPEADGLGGDIFRGRWRWRGGVWRGEFQPVGSAVLEWGGGRRSGEESQGVTPRAVGPQQHLEQERGLAWVLDRGRAGAEGPRGGWNGPGHTWPSPPYHLETTQKQPRLLKAQLCIF